MKRFVIFILMGAVFLTGCESGKSIEPSFPHLKYRNSTYNFDPYNREIEVSDGYILDEGHSYDLVETDSGYDLVLHFIPVEKDGDS